MAMMIGVNLLLVTSIFTFFIFRFKQTIQQDQRLLGESLVSSLAEKSELGLVSNEPFFLKQTFKNLIKKKNILYIAIYSDDGKILLQDSKKNVNLFIPKEEFGTYLNKGFTERHLSAPHEKIGDYITPVVVKEDMEFDSKSFKIIGLARVGISTAKSRTVLNHMVLFTGGISIIALIASTFLTLLITRRITNPLKKLEEGAKRISRGDLDFEIPTTFDAEIAQLADEFNSMSKALKETTVSKGYLDKILESMIDTMIVVNPNGLIQTANRALAKLLEYSHEELIGMPFENILENGADNSILKKGGGLESIIKQGVISDAETYYLTKDSKKIPMSFSGSTIYDEMHEVIGFTCIAQNITRRKAAETDLRRRMKEIEKFNKFMLNREKRILEIKREVNEVLKSTGQPPKYSC